MKLSVLERILVLNALPAEDDIITMRTLRGLKKDLGFTEDELVKLEFKTEDGKTHWNKTVGEREFTLHPKAGELISNALKKLSDTKKLTENHIDLYEKFVG